jgi:hypothetical protein
MYLIGLLFGLAGYPLAQYFQLSMRQLGFSTIQANLLSIPNQAATIIIVSRSGNSIGVKLTLMACILLPPAHLRYPCVRVDQQSFSCCCQPKCVVSAQLHCPAGGCW